MRVASPTHHRHGVVIVIAGMPGDAQPMGSAWGSPAYFCFRSFLAFHLVVLASSHSRMLESPPLQDLY